MPLRTDCGAPSPAHVQPGPPPPLLPAAVQFVLSDSLPTSSYVVPTQQVRCGGTCRHTPAAGLTGQRRRMWCMGCTCCRPRPAECRVCVGTRCLHACATMARLLAATHLHVRVHRLHPSSATSRVSLSSLAAAGAGHLHLPVHCGPGVHPGLSHCGVAHQEAAGGGELSCQAASLASCLGSLVDLTALEAS